MRSWNCACVITLGLTLLTGEASAIVNGAPPDSTDYRFDAIAAFSTTWRIGLDPTHPNAQEHNWYCNATLIAPDQVLLAKHCVTAYVDQSNYAVRFRRNLGGGLGTKADGPDSYYHERIASWVFPDDGSDVALGTLVAPVPHIPPLPVAVSDTTALWQLHSPFIHAGWGMEGPAAGEGEKNQLLLCHNQVTALSADQITYYNAWNPDGPLCGVNNNDSGSPVLLEATDGELRVAGVVASYSGATHLARYADDLSFVFPTAPFGSADLTLAEPIVSSATPLLSIGDVFALNVVVENLGAADATACDVTVQLSTDALLDDGDTELPVPFEVPSVGAGSTFSVNGWLTVPAGTPAGAYSVGLWANKSQQATEALYTNNAWQSPEPLIFFHPNPVSHNGIYIGSMIDDLSGGQQGFFAVYHRQNDTAVFFAFDGSDDRSYYGSAAVGSDGVLSFEDDGTLVTLDLSAEPITGRIGDTLSLSADRQPAAGEVAHLVGYYQGELEGAYQGAAHAVVGPAGDVYLLVDSDDFARGYRFNQSWAELDLGFEMVMQLAGRFDWDEALQVNMLTGVLPNTWGITATFSLPRENTPPPPADIGDPCNQDWACRQGNGGDAAICLMSADWPDGYCVVPDCEDDSCPPETRCTDVTHRGGESLTACLQICTPDGGPWCREGYACVVPEDETHGTCQPGCTTDDDCPRPLVCNDTSGLCEEEPVVPEPVPPQSDEEGGCECRMAEPAHGDRWLLPILLSLLAGLRRAARRAR